MKARASLPEVLAVIPLAGFLWLMLYAGAAYLEAGHWPPVYGRPDPTRIGPWITGYALMGGLLCFIGASPLAVAAWTWVSTRRTLRTKSDRLRAGLTWVRQAAVIALGTVLFATELIRLQDWLLD